MVGLALDRKVLRDLVLWRGQIVAIVLLDMSSPSPIRPQTIMRISGVAISAVTAPPNLRSACRINIERTVRSSSGAAFTCL